MNRIHYAIRTAITIVNMKPPDLVMIDCSTGLPFRLEYDHFFARDDGMLFMKSCGEVTRNRYERRAVKRAFNNRSKLITADALRLWNTRNTKF